MIVFNICVNRLSKTSIVNSFRNRFRPASPIFCLTSGWCMRYSVFSATAVGEFFSVMNPVTPSSTAVGIPPTLVVIHGTPWLIASNSTRLKASLNDGKMKISAFPRADSLALPTN